MSEREKKFLKTMADAMDTMDEAKKEYLLGMADGLALAAERRSENERKGAEEKN